MANYLDFIEPRHFMRVYTAEGELQELLEDRSAWEFYVICPIETPRNGHAEIWAWDADKPARSPILYLLYRGGGPNTEHGKIEFHDQPQEPDRQINLPLGFGRLS